MTINFDADTLGRSQYQVVSITAYLLGIPKSIFENEHEPPKLEVYNKLEKDKPARIVRNLCLIRAVVERNFGSIMKKIRSGQISINQIPEFPMNAVRKLYEDGVNVSYSTRDHLGEYIIKLNRLISDRINNCKSLIPDWINWNYYRDIYIMPNGLTVQGTMQAANDYYTNKQWYPYQVYMNWPAEDEGNILYDDERFVTLLYAWNNDYFADRSKVSNVSAFVQEGVYNFIADSDKTILVVDCENSDPFRLIATLSNFDAELTAKITKIILYNDVHASAAWSIIKDYTEIPVEEILVERILERKSLVDIKLTVGICREHYANNVDSFILASSDSDFWGLIESLPDARFLVMIERDQSSYEFKGALINNNIFYCHIEEFYSGGSTELKKTAVVRELKSRLNQLVHFNVNDLLEEALSVNRTSMTSEEKTQFYNQFIKPMHLLIDEDGNVSVELKKR